MCAVPSSGNCETFDRGERSSAATSRVRRHAAMARVVGTPTASWRWSSSLIARVDVLDNLVV